MPGERKGEEIVYSSLRFLRYILFPIDIAEKLAFACRVESTPLAWISMKSLLVAIVLIGIGFAAQTRAAEMPDPVLPALRAALETNVEHACEWLEGKDYKSLEKSAGGLELLTELLRARSDDSAWQSAYGAVLAHVRGLQSTARSENADACSAALDQLSTAVAYAKEMTPSGQPQSLPKAAGGMRGVMMILEGLQGEAKIALVTGQPAKAKNSAYVLSELGRVISNSRADPQWTSQSTAFIDASLAAARSPAEDSPTLKPLFHAISQRCEVCHETR